jgi:hypothetical protein
MNDEPDSIPADVEWAKGLRGAVLFNPKEVRFFNKGRPADVSINDERGVCVMIANGGWWGLDGPWTRARFRALLLGLGVSQEGGEG